MKLACLWNNVWVWQSNCWTVGCKGQEGICTYSFHKQSTCVVYVQSSLFAQQFRGLKLRPQAPPLLAPWLTTRAPPHRHLIIATSSPPHHRWPHTPRDLWATHTFDRNTTAWSPNSLNLWFLCPCPSLPQHLPEKGTFARVVAISTLWHQLLRQ